MKSTKNEVECEVMWGETLPCPDLPSRLAKIYEVAIKRANEVNYQENNKKAGGKSAGNTSPTLTQNASKSSERADC